MAYGSRPMVMPKKAPSKKKAPPKKKAPANMRSNKGKGKMSKAMLERLLVHSKMHNGMSSKHMRLMIRFVKQGDSFNKAHEKAKKLE